MRQNLKFNAKPITIGTSIGVIIPKSYFDNDLMDKEKEYVFEVLSQ